MLRHIGREEALNVVAAMRGHVVIELDDHLALEAAELSVDKRSSELAAVQLDWRGG